MIKLQASIEAGDQQKTLDFETEEQVISIGRESSNDFQIPVTSVSRQHCRINMSDNQYFVEDLGSSGGTLLNGAKLTPNEKKLIRSGDVLTMAKARVTVTISKSTLERTPGEKTEALAVRAVEDILGRLGAGDTKDDVPFLRVMSGPDEGAKFYLRGPVVECILGRSRESDLVVNDANASRRHAMVKKDYNGVIFQDLGPKNLSQVNGKDVPKNGTKRLKDRDEIAIGSVKITFIDPDAELLRSLGDIPGFEEPPEPEPEPEPEAAPEEVSEPAAGEPVAEPEASADPDAPPEDVPDESPAEDAPTDAPAEASDIALPPPEEDPALQPKASKFGPEMIIVIVGALVVVIGIVVLLLLLL